LYERRKDYQLAKLKKEHEILVNKVRFIRAVIEETIQIERVKRQEIVRQLLNKKFLTMSQLNEIHYEKKKATLVVHREDEDEGDRPEEIEAEVVAEGLVPAKEYDYLLTMPLWSLSEEKIAELNR